MEKLMSFFHPSEKRKPTKFEEGDDRGETPPPDERRKWSISRSGRMKQANKKRLNVSVDLYGETCAPVERPTSLEYHVNSPSPQPTNKEAHTSAKPDKMIHISTEDLKTPEEQIETAFEILDKTDKS